MRPHSLAIVALAAALTGCSVYSSVDSKAKLKPENDRKTAPDFALKDVTGKTVKLSDYAGKVVLLNFWATWCEPCQEEIPWFIDFEQSLKDRNFAVLGVSMDDDGWDSVKPFLAHNKINYRVVIGNEDLSVKFGGIDAIPTTFILDRQGRIAAVHVGIVSRNTYQNEILNLLGRSGPLPQDSVGSASAPGVGPRTADERADQPSHQVDSATPDRSASRRDIVPLVADYLRAK